MISKYGIFCRVIECGSFSRAAESLGYTQSAVSQTVKLLERELGTTLISRKKGGITLTEDGVQYLPYIKGICSAEQALVQKEKEMKGLANSTIRIGTFTSVSRNMLPQKMKQFKEMYPGVSFVLRQGEYTSIVQWLKEGSIDFGFVNRDSVSGIDVRILYQDEMAAVLPAGHPLAAESEVSLRQLAREPFILLDEGNRSVMLDAFEKYGLKPRIEYEVYDDYSILAMVKQGLGVTALYSLVLKGFEQGVEIRPIRERPVRTVSLAWLNQETMPLAARRFVSFLLSEERQ